MAVIAFVSGKGGVGKTSLTAATAVALAQRGRRVLAIDLDPQNALRLHLGMDPADPAGWSREGFGAAAIFESAGGVSFLPFGALLEAELEELEAVLQDDPRWLAERLADAAARGRFDYVLIDTPPGPTVFLQQALQAAHRALVVVLADAASLTTLPMFFPLIDEFTAGRDGFQGSQILINQLPHQSRLGHQVRTAIHAHFPGRVAPVAVHRDAAVAEALAFERTVLDYEPGAEACLDLQHLADWLLATLES
jgi:cellulose synthase operon protein YhjQ